MLKQEENALKVNVRDWFSIKKIEQNRNTLKTEEGEDTICKISINPEPKISWLGHWVLTKKKCLMRETRLEFSSYVNHPEEKY